MQVCLYLFNGKITACQHCSALSLCLCLPVCIFYFFLLVYSLKLIKLFLCCKARISKSLANKLLCIYLINRTTKALLIRTISTLIADFSILVKNSTLVKINAVFSKCFYKSLSCTLNLALSIGILYSKIKYSTRLVS